MGVHYKSQPQYTAPAMNILLVLLEGRRLCLCIFRELLQTYRDLCARPLQHKDGIICFPKLLYEGYFYILNFGIIRFFRIFWYRRVCLQKCGDSRRLKTSQGAQKELGRVWKKLYFYFVKRGHNVGYLRCQFHFCHISWQCVSDRDVSVATGGILERCTHVWMV